MDIEKQKKRSSADDQPNLCVRVCPTCFRSFPDTDKQKSHSHHDMFTVIFQSVQLVEDSDQFYRWETVPQPLDFKVYFWNVTNVAEVQAGGKPRVQEIGPYIYSQYRRKHNIQFADDRETVTYTQQQKYFFNSRASAPLTENDSIVVLNLVMNVSFFFVTTFDTFTT